ncbi:hypothetical protein [Leptolyngbya ohadii]|uniref:hypothetical protein n=1 Tax=Leptolyngbya ohadii TaxID=1962290 RepID=UPI00117B005B|nr:hypothetical protein [Leptolyngbya ohadii]
MNLEIVALENKTIEMKAVRENGLLIREIQYHLARIGLDCNGEATWGIATQIAYNRFLDDYGVRSEEFTPQIAQTLLNAPTVTRLLL